MNLSLRDINKFPPKGWVYRQPETGWSIPNPMQVDFWGAVSQIADHRKANPGKGMDSSDEAVARDLETYTILRLNKDTKWVQGEDAQKKSILRARPKCKTCSKRSG